MTLEDLRKAKRYEVKYDELRAVRNLLKVLYQEKYPSSNPYKIEYDGTKLSVDLPKAKGWYVNKLETDRINYETAYNCLKAFRKALYDYYRKEMDKLKSKVEDIENYDKEGIR